MAKQPVKFHPEPKAGETPALLGQVVLTPPALLERVVEAPAPEAIFDGYAAAALTGLLADGGRARGPQTVAEEAAQFAQELMRQRALQTFA